MSRKSLLFIIVLLLSVICTFSIIFYRSQSKFLSVQDEALKKVRETVDLREVNKFYWFNTEETYYSFEGKTADNIEVYVVLRSDTNEVLTLNKAEVVNEEEARAITVQDKQPKQVMQARLGMIDGEPVWEVNYKTDSGMGYYYLSARTGQWIRDISNI